MNEIQIFKNSDFGEIRTVEIDGENWFVGRDVAVALGYGKGTAPINSIKKHVFEEDKGVTEIMTPSGMQKMVIINESGLYSLIFGSKLESANKFKRWVTSEVLPALHRKGTYAMQSKSEVEVLKLHYNAIMEINQKTDRNKAEIDSVRADFESFKMDLPILGIEKENIKRAMQKCVIRISGGRKSNAYRDKSTRGRIYGEIQRTIRDQLGIKRYDEIKASECKLAMDIIKRYEPSDEMQDTIKMCNAQMNIFVK